MTLASSAFITGRFCPRCGYELTGLLFADRVTCPECGTGTEESALPFVRPPGPFVRKCLDLLAALVTVIGGILLGGVFIGLLSLVNGIFSPRCRPELRTIAYMEMVYQGCAAYAAEFEGRYPKHAAALIPENYFQPDLLEDRYADPRHSNSYLGTYDLMEYDWSEEAIAAAIDSTDLTTPYYRLGDFWWVRLPARTGDPSIVAAWSAPAARPSLGSLRRRPFHAGRARCMEQPLGGRYGRAPSTWPSADPSPPATSSSPSCGTQV